MNKKRLPKSTYPNRYEIELDVDLDNFSYTGVQKVDLNVVEATNNIVLNSVGIEVTKAKIQTTKQDIPCLLYTSPSPRDTVTSRMPSSA